MTFHVVREIKKFHLDDVCHAMAEAGIFFRNPQRASTNIEVMVLGLTSNKLHEILNNLKRRKAAMFAKYGI